MMSNRISSFSLRMNAAPQSTVQSHIVTMTSSDQPTGLFSTYRKKIWMMKVANMMESSATATFSALRRSQRAIATTRDTILKLNHACVDDALDSAVTKGTG